MGDVCAFLPSFQHGWTFGTRGLEFSQRLAIEDLEATLRERTKMSYLKLWMGWKPSLALLLRFVRMMNSWGAYQH